jgi:signal peptidase I
MGDHRSQSGDSLMHWEQTEDITEATIAKDTIVGRAFTIFWPVGRATWLSVPKEFDGIPDAAKAK